MSDHFTDPDPNAVTDDEISQIAEKLSKAEDLWDTLMASSSETIPCPECSAGGHISAGVFGVTACATCGGARMIADPLGDDVDLGVPDLTGQRRRLGVIRKAWSARQLALRDGQPLPPPPSRQDLEALRADVDASQAGADAKRKELRAQREQGKLAAPARTAPAPQLQASKSWGASDDELDDLLDEEERDASRSRR